MRDLVVLAMTGAFFTACVAYVRLCDRIIGPDPVATAGASSEPLDGPAVAAGEARAA